jgi:hypothetical protein
MSYMLHKFIAVLPTKYSRDNRVTGDMSQYQNDIMRVFSMCNANTTLN